jgi:hypothetical protein
MHHLESMEELTFLLASHRSICRVIEVRPVDNGER